MVHTGMLALSNQHFPNVFEFKIFLTIVLHGILEDTAPEHSTNLSPKSNLKQIFKYAFDFPTVYLMVMKCQYFIAHNDILNGTVFPKLMKWFSFFL